MIGKLQGIVDYIGDGFVILLVNGVGYKVFTPEYLTHKSTVELWIETIVREDSIRLFGFSTLNAQNLFNMLTTVSGVGPKVALAILGTINSDTLMSAIATNDAKTIATAPGVGKKMAEKISPNKTLVGGIGGFVGGFLGAIAVYFIYNAICGTFENMAFWLLGYGVTGLLAAGATEFGDLVESAIKRKVGIKDIGKLLPGHGGVLDRIDGTLFAAVPVYLIFMLAYLVTM